MRLLLIPGIRERISLTRFAIFKRTRKIKSYEDVRHVDRVSYSLSALEKYASIRERVDFLVSSLANSKRFTEKSKLLVLGPRYESEIFGYLGLGFIRKNVHAIDTHSYSKLITPGNLHNLPFDSNCFDFVVCGWTLAYSEKLTSALSEIHRVMKQGGLLIMTFDLQEGETVDSLADLRIANEENPLLQLILPQFELRNWFLGKTSWSDKRNICCLSLEKLQVLSRP